jgi:hypothetical protein
MDAGEVRRKESEIFEYPENKESEIKKYPDNWDEMVKKLQEREDEQLKKVLARRKAETEAELEELSNKAIVKRALRAASDHRPLKDRTILQKPKTPEIENLREALHKEIEATTEAIGQRVLKEFPSLENKVPGLSKLKGRITPKGPAPSA